MSDLSSLDNGGLSGVHTIQQKRTPKIIQINGVVPGTIGTDRDDGYTQVRVRPAVEEGHIMLYGPPGTVDGYNMYCAVNIDGELVWKPVFIYEQIYNTKTGEILR